MRKKVLVIGLDGATLDLIAPWAREKKLPAFARLMEEGSYGPLESTPNQRSASAWTSLMTGKNPGKHGIYEFYDYVPGTYTIRFLNASNRDAESLWGQLSRHGKKVVVINVPMTFPAEEVNGALIAGLDAPGPNSKGFAHPPGLHKRLSETFGNYLLEPGITGFMVGGKIEAALENLHRELDQKFRIADHLMSTSPWDFFMVVFRSLDAVQHCFWRYMDPLHPGYTEEAAGRYGHVIYDVYRRVDQYIGRLLREMDGKVTLLVVSDHGFGRKHTATAQLNRWLESKGYLAMNGGGDPASGGSRRGFQTRLLAGLYRAIVGRTSRRLKEKLVRLLPGLRDTIQSRLVFSGIDWSRTHAYTDTLFPNIMINRKGREPLGIVGEEEYGELLQRIKDDLKRCVDSTTGERIVDDVFRRDEIYSGKHTDQAPDLLVRWREDIPIHGIRIDESGGSKDASPPAYPLIPGEDPRVISGDHRLNGIFFIRGDDIAKNRTLTGARIIDFAPTVLYLLDCPLSEDLDGKVLLEAFTGSHVEKHPPRRERMERQEKSHDEDQTKAPREYSEEESEIIAARLRDLGYLE